MIRSSPRHARPHLISTTTTGGVQFRSKEDGKDNSLTYCVSIAFSLTDVIDIHRSRKEVFHFVSLGLRLRCGPAATGNHFLFSSRKEVFQPHLPVRLPCYDLAPITSFALGRSLR